MGLRVETNLVGDAPLPSGLGDPEHQGLGHGAPFAARGIVVHLGGGEVQDQGAADLLFDLGEHVQDRRVSVGVGRRG